MTTDQKTSTLIESQVPFYLREEGPKLVAFLKAYYEFLEQTGNMTETSKNILNYQDIDSTLDKFIDYFRREVLSEFPSDIQADKRQVVKKIRDLYKAKGSEAAHKLLFRILFNEDIDIYLPGQDILRASDGRWVKESSIKVSQPFIGNPTAYLGKNIIGVSSGATAFVEKVTQARESGVIVFELFLSNITGDFLESETVTSTDNTLSSRILSGIGSLREVTITRGGYGHRAGDSVSFSSGSGSGASGRVTKTTDTGLGIRIINGGSGYTTESTIRLIGGEGQGASATISAISNVEFIQYFTDTISDLSGTLINANTFGTSNTGSLSSNLFSANSGSVLGSSLGTANVLAGSISSISVIPGSEFVSDFPEIEAQAEPYLLDIYHPTGIVPPGSKGYDAVFEPFNVPGAISEVLVTEFGLGYNKLDPVTVTNITRENTGNGEGNPVVAGVNNYPGKYIDTKGFLSWNNRLQDNFFYQEFSYLIRSSKFLTAYKKIVENTVHPIGTKLFGEVQIQANVDVGLTSTVERSFKVPVYIISTTAAPTVETTIYTRPMFLQSVPSTTTISTDITFDVAFDLTSVDSTAVVSANSILDMQIPFDPDYIFFSQAHNLTGEEGQDIIGEHFGEELIILENTLTANSVINIQTFGTSIVLPTISPASVTSTESISTDNQLNFIIDPNSVVNVNIVSPVDAQLNFAYTLDSITSTTNISTDNIFEITVDPITFTSFIEGNIQISSAQVAELSGAQIQTYSANTFLDTIPVVRIPSPELI